MLLVDAIEKSYKKKKGWKTQSVSAIKDVSFSAEDGKIIGLLGENGAGKSTILRIICGIINADSGNVSINGFDIRQQAQLAAQQIGFLPHNSGIYPRLSARENIEYFARLCEIDESSLQSRLEALIDELGMHDFIDRKAEGFSQGQTTKVALARTLVHKPQTILLDEPTNGLDVMATRKLRRVLTQLKDAGHCILFSSHIMQEVSALCDEVCILHEGEIKTQGRPEAIMQETKQNSFEEAFIVSIGHEVEQV